MEAFGDWDPLTRLPRAGRFQSRVDELQKLADAGVLEPKSFTVLLVILKDLAELESERGDEAIRRLLTAVADRLVRDSGAELVARVSLDSFALLRKRPRGESQGQWERSIRMLCRNPFDVDGSEITLRFATTYVAGPREDARDLLWLAARQADFEKGRDITAEQVSLRSVGQVGTLLLVENMTLRENIEIFRHQAQTDSLTGLLNRRGLDAALSQSQQPTAVAFVDLDDLKGFNDLDDLWNDGDRAIAGVAHVLQSGLPSALVARWSGDEFLIVDLTSSAAELCGRLEQLLEVCRTTVIVSGRSVTFSGGVASVDDDVHAARTLAQRRVKSAKRMKATIACG